ncbi:MAG: zinc carboxypeptidase [Planctomycetaceae bacterium]|nr:MAG: zinc carboxypeptidase [Planctomycetaceae bacterium]
MSRIFLAATGRHIGCGLAACLIVFAGTPAALGQLTVSADFPGGSAEVLVIDVDSEIASIEVRPKLRYDRGWPCWWYFRVDGAVAGQRLNVTVRANQEPFREGRTLSPAWALPRRAAISSDNVHWSQTDPGEAQRDRITYPVLAPATTFWLAWGPPFQSAHADELLALIAAKVEPATPFELARTREGRAVNGIRLGNPDAGDVVWIQARQHAWESGSSWVAEGFVRWVACDDPAAVRLRERTQIVFIPIMDVDNVQLGAGGKDATPRDHNRDWCTEPIYPEVAAAQVLIGQLIDAGRLRVFLDLHNPAAGDKLPFYFGPSDYENLPEVERSNYDRFLSHTVRRVGEPIGFLPHFRSSDYIKTKEERDRVSRHWVAGRGGPDLTALTLETSWDTDHGTISGYRKVGQGLARALADFLTDE